MASEKYDFRNNFDPKNKLNLTVENQDLNIDYIKLQTILKISRLNVSKSCLVEDIKQIDKDIDRTGYLNELENDKKCNDEQRESIKNALRNILITFAAFNQTLTETNKDLSVTEVSLGYTQG